MVVPPDRPSRFADDTETLTLQVLDMPREQRAASLDLTIESRRLNVTEPSVERLLDTGPLRRPRAAYSKLNGFSCSYFR